MEDFHKLFEEEVDKYKTVFERFVGQKIEKARDKDMVFKEIKEKFRKKESTLERGNRFIDYITATHFFLPFKRGANIDEIIDNVSHFAETIKERRFKLESRFLTMNKDDYERVFMRSVISEPISEGSETFEITHVPSSWFEENALFTNVYNLKWENIVSHFAKAYALSKFNEGNLNTSGSSNMSISESKSFKPSILDENDRIKVNTSFDNLKKHFYKLYREGYLDEGEVDKLIRSCFSFGDAVEFPPTVSFKKEPTKKALMNLVHTIYLKYSSSPEEARVWAEIILIKGFGLKKDLETNQEALARIIKSWYKEASIKSLTNFSR